MSLKRKASELEESSASPEPRMPSLSSSQDSTLSNYATDEAPYNLWNIAGAPYFNSRTRKRFRDGRASEETIHEQTLRKLFDAQRRQQSNAAGDTTRNLRFQNSVELISGPANRVEVPPERNQRSIQSFFASVPPDRMDTHAPPLQPPTPDSVFAVQPPLTQSLYQEQEHAAHLVRPHPSTLPSVLTCEDCDAPLLTKTSGEAIDAEMCDVDGGPVLDPEVEEGWVCVLCMKRVCDVCAVRGDYRVCLDCAVPGGGRYKPEELREKRWVGGIGWM